LRKHEELHAEHFKERWQIWDDALFAWDEKCICIECMDILTKELLIATDHFAISQMTVKNLRVPSSQRD